jgi:integrase
MPVYDRWHLTHPDPKRDKPCRCSRGKNKLYPSREHGQGARWQVRWKDEHGKGQRANRPELGGGPDDTNSDVYAKALDAKVHADLAAGTYIDPSAGAVTFREYAEEVVASRTLDPSSRDQMRLRLARHAYPVIGDKELRALARRPSLVQGLIARLQERCGPPTVKVVMAHVGTVLAAAVADGLIGKNPMASSVVKVPPIPKREVVPWTAAMVAAVRDALPGQLAAMVDVGAGLGLRQGEILGLSPDDIDWVSGVVHVERQVKIVRGRLVFALPKREKKRDIPLPPAVEAALRAHMKAFPATAVTLPWREPGGDPREVRLLFHRGGRALHRDRHVNPAWRKALGGVVPDPAAREHGMHALRHYFACCLLTAGEAVHAVAEWMGHHSPKVTWDVYAHVMPKSGQRMRGIIDVALGMPGADTTARKVPDPEIADAATQVSGPQIAQGG